MLKTNDEHVSSSTFSLLRDSGYNLVSQIINIVLALWSLPIMVRYLGDDDFGMLALVLAVVGYFGFLDFGISRANTKYLAEAVSKNNNTDIHNVVWTSVTISVGVGVLSGLLIVLSSSFLISGVLNIAEKYSADVHLFFIAIGCGIPFMLLFGTIKGFQMALHRFKIVNIFQILISMFQWLGSVVILFMGFGFYEVVLLIISTRIFLSVISLLILPKLIPNIFNGIKLWDTSTAKSLFRFGGWVSLSQIISPLFMYIDRFILGIYLPISAVTYYTVPQEAINKILIIPISVTSVLFPFMSKQSVLRLSEQKTEMYYTKSVKYIFIIILPLLSILFIFAYDLMQLWIGSEIAHKSVPVLQIMIIGILFNAIAAVPSTLLQAYGHPDITAKLHMIELPIVVLLNILLIPLLGVIGAAMAWSMRVVLDSYLLFLFVNKKIFIMNNMENKKLLMEIIKLFLSALLICSLDQLLSFTIFYRIVFVFTGVSIYCIHVWYRIFDAFDRGYIIQIRNEVFRMKV